MRPLHHAERRPARHRRQTSVWLRRLILLGIAAYAGEHNPTCTALCCCRSRRSGGMSPSSAAGHGAAFRGAIDQ